jgi:hypothetical protein
MFKSDARTILLIRLCQFCKQGETQLFIYKHDPKTLKDKSTRFLGNTNPATQRSAPDDPHTQ